MAFLLFRLLLRQAPAVRLGKDRIRRPLLCYAHAYWGDDGIWSGGYFISTVGLNEDMIRNYIAQQGAEDGGQAKLDF